MNTWTDRLGHSNLRSFTDEEGHFWLEQNAAKPSKWGKFAREGNDVAWEFARPGGVYTGRMLINGEIYTRPKRQESFCMKSGSTGSACVILRSRMTKNSFIDQIAESTERSKPEAEQVVEAVLSRIAEAERREG